MKIETMCDCLFCSVSLLLLITPLPPPHPTHAHGRLTLCVGRPNLEGTGRVSESGSGSVKHALNPDKAFMQVHYLKVSSRSSGPLSGVSCGHTVFEMSPL